ncbi:hypothetical protein [Salaquimonas pukyongi]|uniref:hypothetical protein n=1 Tax=Salaquimonas pukyongi TaxID=2712698 RepID=UPI0012EB76EE|nr:hypothetical protein [Salaquimonas pukyongi]
MTRQSMKTEIEEIASNRKLNTQEQIAELERLREDVRAQMRAETEGGAASDRDFGEELKLLDEALEALNTKPESIEDSGAATL